MRSLAILAALALSSPALAVPLELTHQGRLFDDTGAALFGSHNLTFTLYDDATTGNELWTETHSAVDFDEGYFQAQLGGVNPLSTSVFDGDSVWLAIAVDSGAELPSRLPLTSVPFAVRASVAESLAGGIDWSDVSGAPSGLDDGDDDSLTGITGCTPADVLTWDGTDWSCAAIPAPSDLDAAVITSGIFPLSRIPVGTGPTEVAAGDHVHSAADVGALPVGTTATDIGALPDTTTAVDIGGLASTTTATDIGALPDSTTATDIGALPDSTTATDIGALPDSTTAADIGALPDTATAADIGALPDTATAADIGALPDTATASDVGALDLTGGTLTGSLQLGDDSAACDAAAYGTLRWSGGSLQLCINDDWTSIKLDSTAADAVADLVTWVMADKGTTVSSGTDVATWVDQSGNGNHWTQGTVSRQPNITANALNGLPVLTHAAGRAEHLQVNVNFPAPSTVIYVGRHTGGANSRMLSGRNNNWLLGFWGGNRRMAYHQGWISPSNTPASDTAWHIWTSVMTGSTSTIFEDRTQLFQNAGGVTGPNGLCTSGHLCNSEFSNGQIAEIAVYDRNLSSTELDTVWTYLQGKWGL